MNQYQFDDSRIAWNALEGFDHLWYSILAIDESRQIVDVLFKFAANQQIVLHRHKALNVMLVIQGEHRLYKPNGDILEVRPAGKFTVSPASDEPHREGGGTEQDVIVYFSIRGSDGVLYEILDDSQNTVGALTMADFVMLYQQQPPLQA